MGGCGLKARGVSNQVTQYDSAPEPIEYCECGQAFIPQEARFCCFCGRKRDASPCSSPSSHSPKNTHFSPIYPSTCSSNGLSPPHPSSPTRRLSGRAASTTSNSTSATHKSGGSNHSSEDGSNGCYTSGSEGVHYEVHYEEEDVVASTLTPPSPRLPTPSSSQAGTPARRPSFADGPPIMFDANGLPVEDVVTALSQALKHSGSIVTQNWRMRALQVPESLIVAHNAVAKPDMLMPQFDAKVDLDNLLDKLPLNSLKSSLSLQRVTFMSTDWLGIRLVHSDHARCTRFCLCATALQNIGKSTSRSVVVEVSDEDQCLVFACSPLYVSSRRSEWKTSFVNHAEEIGELAQMISNECGNSDKKVIADLKIWCQKTQKRLEDDAQNAFRRASQEVDLSRKGSESDGSHPEKDCRVKGPRFSLSGFVKSLEESFAILGNDSKPRNASAKGAARRRGSEPNLNRARSGSGQQSVPPERKVSEFAQQRKRRHSMGAALHSEESPRRRGDRLASGESRDQNEGEVHSPPRISPRSSRKNSDASFDPSAGSQDHILQKSPRMKRRPSFKSQDILPSLDEDKESVQDITVQHVKTDSARPSPVRVSMQRRHSLPALDTSGIYPKMDRLALPSRGMQRASSGGPVKSASFNVARMSS